MTGRPVFSDKQRRSMAAVAAEAIAPLMISMQDPQTGDFPEYFQEKPN